MDGEGRTCRLQSRGHYAGVKLAAVRWVELPSGSVDILAGLLGNGLPVGQWNQETATMTLNGAGDCSAWG